MPQGEISTTSIVRDALASGKEVFIPYTHKLAETGKESTQPKISVMDMLRLESMEEFESLRPDKWGIPSLDKSSIPLKQNCLGGTGVLPERPRGGSDDLGLDLIVMPGMAFDTDLRRLGHGKGEIAGSPRASQRPFLGKTDFPPSIYCKTIQVKTNADRMANAVALALVEQIILPPEAIPVASHDQPVDAVIVGDGRLIVAKTP
ncbi:hypothetical protein UA08_07483 [Talaromyces atroroseus]|uniref:5-formyltetrahydrofolate cyclo-ligase n=1 Tax=Talaromyces atroroseus TaxID=1441469 RepID=A0A225AUH9_TALAT|nr:hypothetical protein UA08_07483 [Talaromyces atroroseus]OKL57127.1 hypothetical protein UA08_07483 [Talaromyces atroroseus]